VTEFGNKAQKYIVQNETSPPQSHWEERIAKPYSRECTRPLHVLAVQCPRRQVQLLSHYRKYWL